MPLPLLGKLGKQITVYFASLFFDDSYVHNVVAGALPGPIYLVVKSIGSSNLSTDLPLTNTKCRLPSFSTTMSKGLGILS